MLPHHHATLTGRRGWRLWGWAVLGVAIGAAWPALAGAQIVVSANDAKAVLVDGVNTPVRKPPPDTVTVLDFGTFPPRVLGTVQAPASVIGPPQSVAITPDAGIGLVTASTKIDPADPTKTAPDDVVTVIDVRAAPPKVIATLHAGRGAAGVSINRAGTLALVANRSDGTVSVFSIAGRTVTPVGTVDLGAADCLPSHVVFTMDGKRALVTRNNDDLISVLAVDGTRVSDTRQPIAEGPKPYGIEVAPDGAVALVANIGLGPTGGTDTIAVLDLAARPMRVVSQVPAGAVLEGLSISSDGRFVAVTVMNGTNTPKASPLFHDFGLLKVFRLDGQTLTPVTEARIGHWCQGAAWSRDSQTLGVQCMVERSLLLFKFDGRTLTAAGTIAVNGGPAGIRAAER